MLGNKLVNYTRTTTIHDDGTKDVKEVIEDEEGKKETN